MDVEKFVVLVRVFQYLVQVVAIGVRDEDLSKIVSAYQPDDLLHALCVEFVEDVVEQQQGSCLAPSTAQEVELCQFQGNQE